MPQCTVWLWMFSRYYKFKTPSILGCSWNLNHSIFDSLLPSECELDFSVTTSILSFKMLHGFHTLMPACMICFLLIDLLMWWYIIYVMLLLVCCNIFCFGVGGGGGGWRGGYNSIVMLPFIEVCVLYHNKLGLSLLYYDWKIVCSMSQ